MRLQEEDVILCENSIDFAMKNQNPLDNVHFFDNFDSQHKYSMRKNTVSPMFPDIFQASSCLHHAIAQLYHPACFLCLSAVADCCGCLACILAV